MGVFCAQHLVCGYVFHAKTFTKKPTKAIVIMQELPFIIAAVIFSAFFSGMEIAFVTSNKLRLEITKKQNTLSARILTHFTENPSRYITTMLVGNMIALVLYGIMMAKLMEPGLMQFTNGHAGYTILLEILLASLIVLLTAEFLPRILFRVISNAALNFFAFPLAFFYYLFYPLVQFSLWLSSLAGRLFGVDTNEADRVEVLSKTDLEEFVHQDDDDAGQPDSTIDKDLKIFKNALDFSDIRLRECMVPRTEMVAVEVSADINELTQAFTESGFSKIFVYQDSIDKILGYVSAHDLFKEPESVKAMIKKALIVPETMTAQDLLQLFISESKGIAVVVDEFGGTSGIVSIEDILEEIFGEIEDEYDTVDLVDKKLPDGNYVFSGRVEIDYLNEEYELELRESDEYETLAGYILWLHGSIPHQGEIISDPDNEEYSFQILRAGDTRIELVKLITDQ